MVPVLTLTNVQRILIFANVLAALIQLAIISVNVLQLPLKGYIYKNYASILLDLKIIRTFLVFRIKMCPNEAKLNVDSGKIQFRNSIPVPIDDSNLECVWVITVPDNQIVAYKVHDNNVRV